MAEQTNELAKLVGYKQVSDALAVSRSTIERAVKAGELPAPRKIKSRSVWLASEINAWGSKLFEGRLEDLSRAAVANPDDLEPDQLEEQAIQLIQKSLEKRTGSPVKLDALDVRLTRAITEDEFNEAVAQEFSIHAERFSAFDKRRACVLAAWLFESLREDILNSAPGREKDIYSNPKILEGFGKIALNDEDWEDCIARFDALT